MSGDDQQVLRTGDTVVFSDAYTKEIKYGRLDRVYGSSFILRVIPQEEAGTNPKPLTVGASTMRRHVTGRWVRVCGSHWVELVECEVRGEENNPGVGHIKAWTSPVSGKQFLAAEGL